MKPKKTKRANLESKRGIFFQIGLLTSLTLLIAAFEWSSVPGYDSMVQVPDGIFIEEDFTQVTREKIIPPPPPIQNPPDFLTIVEETDPFKDDFLVFEAEPPPGLAIPIPDLPPEPEDIETVPEYAATEKPDFRGEGLNGFRVWVAQNLRYPEIAIENRISGVVVIQFTVNSKGHIQDVLVLRKVDPSLDNEAVRVVSSSPAWSPGKRGIKPVNVVFAMPVNFVLN